MGNTPPTAQPTTRYGAAAPRGAVRPQHWLTAWVEQRQEEQRAEEEAARERNDLFAKVHPASIRARERIYEAA
jgi:hypothetical protein